MQHDNEVNNDLVREATPTTQEDKYPTSMTFDEEGNKIDIDEAGQHDDEQLEGETTEEAEGEEQNEQQPAGKPQAHSGNFNKAGHEGKEEIEVGGNAGGRYMGSWKEAIGSIAAWTMGRFSLLVPPPVLLFARPLWSTDTGLILATLAIYLLYTYVVYIHVPMVPKRSIRVSPWMSFFTYHTFHVLAFMPLLHLCLRVIVRRLCPPPPPLIV